MQPCERMRYYPAVGPAIPRGSVGRLRVTHPFAGHHCWCPRLACVKHAASVRPEPGSNSPMSLHSSSGHITLSRLTRCVCPTARVRITEMSGKLSPIPQKELDRRVCLAHPRSRSQLSINVLVSKTAAAPRQPLTLIARSRCVNPFCLPIRRHPQRAAYSIRGF
jgi:hypothetical protein